MRACAGRQELERSELMFASMRTSAGSRDSADKLLCSSEQQGLTGASISVRLVRGTRVIGGSLTFLVLFVGQVMADGASADRTEDAMVAGVMACDAADQRAL
jgi:hypothetical protein